MCDAFILAAGQSEVGVEYEEHGVFVHGGLGGETNLLFILPVWSVPRFCVRVGMG